MATRAPTQYPHLEPRPGSNYRQFFLKGRRIRAAVIDEAVHGPEPALPKNSLGTIRYRSMRSSRLSIMSSRIGRSSSKSGRVAGVERHRAPGIRGRHMLGLAVARPQPAGARSNDLNKSAGSRVGLQLLWA